MATKEKVLSSGVRLPLGLRGRTRAEIESDEAAQDRELANAEEREDSMVHLHERRSQNRDLFFNLIIAGLVIAAIVCAIGAFGGIPQLTTLFLDAAIVVAVVKQIAYFASNGVEGMRLSRV